MYSSIFSHKLNIPTNIFNVSGMLTIVPGNLVYQAFQYIEKQSFLQAIEVGTQAIMVAISISIGFLFSNVVYILKEKIHN